MARVVPCAAAFVFAMFALGCNTPAPEAAAEDVKPVAPPECVVGKWRVEAKGEKDARVTTYHFMKDGRVEVGVQIATAGGNATDLVKRTITQAQQDRITVVDISRTGADGVEQVIPAERRRPRGYQVQVKDDVMSMIEVDDAGKPKAGAASVVLKRVKE